MTPLQRLVDDNRKARGIAYERVSRLVDGLTANDAQQWQSAVRDVTDGMAGRDNGPLGEVGEDQAVGGSDGVAGN